MVLLRSVNDVRRFVEEQQEQGEGEEGIRSLTSNNASNLEIDFTMYKSSSMNTERIRLPYRQSIPSSQLADAIIHLGCRTGSGPIEVFCMRKLSIEGDIQVLLDALLHNCKNHLLHLHVQGCYFDPTFFATTVQQFSKLQSLVLLGQSYRRSLSMQRHRTVSSMLLLSTIQNDTLKTLEFDDTWGFHTPEEASEFFDAIHVSRNLKEIHYHSKLTEAHLVLAGKLISQNRSLEILKIHVSENTPLGALADGLLDNNTLHTMEIIAPHPSDSDLQCFLRVLETRNHTLKTFLISDESMICRGKGMSKMVSFHGKLDQRDDVRKKIDFYLRLNKAGREKILAGNYHDAGDWLDTLTNEDPSVIFYFTRHCPFPW